MRNMITLLFLMAVSPARSFSAPVPDLFAGTGHLCTNANHAECTKVPRMLDFKAFGPAYEFHEVFDEEESAQRKNSLPDYSYKNSMGITAKSVKPKRNSVRFNELLPDPSPSAGLPETEFIELINDDTSSFNLAGWIITDLTSQAVLDSFLLDPGKYLILCHPDDTALFTAYGPVLGVSGLPSLNNSSDELTLISAENDTIDLLAYDQSWYKEPAKKAGGWSLERSRGQAHCNDLWQASESNKGGTPGAENSRPWTDTDLNAPRINNIFALHPDTIEIWVSEPPYNPIADHFTLYPAVQINSLDIDEAGRIKLVLNENLQPSEKHTLNIRLSDCAGNDTAFSIDFQVAETRSEGVVLINEVLFNPLTGGSDFVELYNISKKPVHLFGWQLASLADDQLQGLTSLGSYGIFIQPESYVVITPDSMNIKTEYPFSVHATFLQTKTFPSYNNEYGSVILLDPGGAVAERFDYHEDMHFHLLDKVDGVSLERLSHTLPATDRANWHSASSHAGYATPGYRNSQSISTIYNKALFDTGPGIFSPDLDGYQDLLVITYNLEEPGLLASLTIFDEMGLPVRFLARNDLLGTTGNWVWDGRNEDGRMAPPGIYVIFITCLSADGRIIKEKLPAVLAKKL